MLLAALEALEVDTAEFFASVFGPADPVAVFKTEAFLLRRGKRPPRVLVLERGRDSAKSAAEADLRVLDGQWHEDPKGVMRRAKALISQVGDAQVAPLLGVYGSASRIAGRLEEAQVVFARALELAQERAAPAVLGNLLLRSSYVVGDRGSLELACELCQKSITVCLGGGDFAGVGKALTAQGTWLACLGRHRESVRACQAAIRYFPRTGESASDRRYKVCCLMSIGITYRNLGDLESAQRYARLARKDAGGIPNGLLGKLIGLQATIARRLGQMELAERHYREVLDLHRDDSPLDAALAALAVVYVQLLRRRVSQAYATAKSILPLLNVLERNPVAGAALTEVLRSAIAGRGLSLGLLTKASRTIAKGRTRSKRRARYAYPE